MAEKCSTRATCTLDRNIERDLNNAISLLETALDYFEPGDGDRLKARKGLSFYDNLTTATNKVYSSIGNEDFGYKIDEAIEWLKLGG